MNNESPSIIDPVIDFSEPTQETDFIASADGEVRRAKKPFPSNHVFNDAHNQEDIERLLDAMSGGESTSDYLTQEYERALSSIVDWDVEPSPAEEPDNLSDGEMRSAKKPSPSGQVIDDILNQAEVECLLEQEFRKAAEQGDAKAMFRLGRHYCGRSEENTTEGMRWYHQAAEQGHVEAQYTLGKCYLKGKYVSEDEAEAVKWFRKAAEQGHAGAQYELGKCCIIEAEKWLRAAAQSMDDENIDTILTLIELTRKQIERSCYPADER